MATDNPDRPERGGTLRATQLTRRDFARFGAVAGAVVWTAPRITTINFAQKIVGSGGNPHGGSTTTSTSPPDTESSSSTSTSTSTSTTSTTEHTEGSTVSTSTSTTSSTVHTQGSSTTTTECKPGNGFGDPNHCHTGPPGQTNVAGAKTGNNDPSSGPLAFTGADTLELAAVAAIAIVGGRALYSLSKRRNDGNSATSPVDDDATPRTDI